MESTMRDTSLRLRIQTSIDVIITLMNADCDGMKAQIAIIDN